MTWTRLSDDFTDDCWTLTDEAFRLHVEGLVWSNRKLLNLRIPKDEVRRFAKCPDAVAELLAVGWWSEDGDTYVIVHHGMYQRLKAQVVAQQRANTRNGRRGGRPPGPGREQVTDLETESASKSLSDSPTERDGTGQDWLGQEVQTREEASWQGTNCPYCEWPTGSAAHEANCLNVGAI